MAKLTGISIDCEGVPLFIPAEKVEISELNGANLEVECPHCGNQHVFFESFAEAKWGSRTYNFKKKTTRCKCGKPAMHDSTRDGVTTHLCCACHVASGDAPADWHPDCMAAARQRTT